MTLPKPECEGGFTKKQITEIMGVLEGAFWKWMNGQTAMFCEGRIWDHKKQKYVPSCNGIAHGDVVYVHDVQRFLDGRPIID